MSIPGMGDFHHGLLGGEHVHRCFWACKTPTLMSSSPDNRTHSAMARFRASVIMSVTKRESTPSCWPCLFTMPTARGARMAWCATVAVLWS